MWSRGITTLALCVTVVSGVLAALPAPPYAMTTQASLTRALALAPAAVAAWKRADKHAATARHAARKSSGKKRIKSRLDPFGKKIFAGS